MPSVAPAVGALRQWQAELKAGVRSPSDADALWLAAAWEASAAEALGLGDTYGANAARTKAAEILAAELEGCA